MQYALREKTPDANDDTRVEIAGDPTLAEALDAVEMSWKKGDNLNDRGAALSTALSDITRRVAFQMGWGDLAATRESGTILEEVSHDTNVRAVATSLAEYGERWMRRVGALKAMVSAADRERINAGRPNGSRGQNKMEPKVVAEVACALAQSDEVVRRALTELELAEERSKQGTSRDRAAVEKARLNLMCAVMRTMEGVVAMEGSMPLEGTGIDWSGIVATVAKASEAGNGAIHVGENELAMRAKELLKKDAQAQDSLHGFKARSETAWKKVTVLRRLLPGIQAVDAAAGDVMKDLHDVNKHGVPFGASFPESANADVDIDLLASDERVEEALKTLSSIEKEEADELAAQQKSPGSGAATANSGGAQERSQRRQEAFRVILRAAKTRSLHPAPSYSTLGGYPGGGNGGELYDDEIDDDVGEHLSVSDALARLGVGIPSSSPFASRGQDRRATPNDFKGINEYGMTDFGSPRSQFDRSAGIAVEGSQPTSMNASENIDRMQSTNNDNASWLRDFYSNTPNLVHHLDEVTHHNRVLHAVDRIHG